MRSTSAMVDRIHRWRTAGLMSALAALALATVVGVGRARSRKASAAAPVASRAQTVPAPVIEPTAPANPGAAQDARVSIGHEAFFDPNLSTPPGTPCSGCHDPERGYAGANGSSRGVPRGSRPGHFARRAAPSLLYVSFVRSFRFHWDEEADFPEARGGFFWDGREDSIARLVRQPLLNPDEMNDKDARTVAARLEAAPYADDLRHAFAHAFDTPERALEVLGECLDAFLTSPAMSPFSSRYDDYVRGQADLTALEKKGLAIFKDHARGACSGCHTVDDRSRNPARSLFTDYGYETLSVPRNRRLSPDAASAPDLGLCGRPDRKWHSDDDRYCGAFRTPSLRNVALRPAFMHNGVFTKLRDVVAFYATRATNPERWYPGGGDYDDLPRKYWPYVNDSPAPYHRRRGDAPVLDDADVDALVAFLETLTDRAIPR